MEDGQRPELDTSVKKVAILANGEAAFITGKGLAVAGTQQEIDVTRISSEDEAHLRKNLGDIRVSQKGDKITLRPRQGRAVIIKDESK